MTGSDARSELAPAVDDSSVELDPEEIRRYGRHLVLPEVGMAGQKRLKAARVLLVGVGGLGSPAALYLAAAGVGTLGLVDFDRVDASNLQRQVLYGTGDVGRPKVEAATERLRDLNPHIAIEPHDLRLDAGNVLELVSHFDLVVDGSDNFATRYLVNDACVRLGKPLVWGAVLRFTGQVALFAMPDGPCYRCLFPAPPPAGSVPNCAEGGVFGVLPGIIGSLQAAEVIRFVLDRGTSLAGRFVTFDALTTRMREIQLPRDPRCPACGPEARPDAPLGIGQDPLDAHCSAGPAGPAVTRVATRQNKESPMMDATDLPFQISVETLDAWRREGREHRLVDVREPHEVEIAAIEGADLIPLGQIPERLDSFDADTLHVLQCHHGGRSARAVEVLRSRGLRATNLEGGIEAWSRRIDSSVPRY